MGAEPGQLLPVCRANQEEVPVVLQQRPFLTQLLYQQSDVGRFQGGGVATAATVATTRVVSGLARGDRVATEAATHRDSGCG